jgi:hypothetical protein
MHSPTLRRVPLVGPNLHILGLARNTFHLERFLT